MYMYVSPKSIIPYCPKDPRKPSEDSHNPMIFECFLGAPMFIMSLAGIGSLGLHTSVYVYKHYPLVI